MSFPSSLMGGHGRERKARNRSEGLVRTSAFLGHSAPTSAVGRSISFSSSISGGAAYRSELAITHEGHASKAILGRVFCEIIGMSMSRRLLREQIVYT
jgi:hypothetical protein